MDKLSKAILELKQTINDISKERNLYKIKLKEIENICVGKSAVFTKEIKQIIRR